MCVYTEQFWLSSLTMARRKDSEGVCDWRLSVHAILNCFVTSCRLQQFRCLSGPACIVQMKRQHHLYATSVRVHQGYITCKEPKTNCYQSNILQHTVITWVSDLEHTVCLTVLLFNSGQRAQESWLQIVIFPQYLWTFLHINQLKKGKCHSRKPP